MNEKLKQRLEWLNAIIFSITHAFFIAVIHKYVLLFFIRINHQVEHFTLVSQVLLFCLLVSGAFVNGAYVGKGIVGKRILKTLIVSFGSLLLCAINIFRNTLMELNLQISIFIILSIAILIVANIASRLVEKNEIENKILLFLVTNPLGYFVFYAVVVGGGSFLI